MRCAYQMAVRSCGRGAVSGTCPDCATRFKVFYTGDPNGDIRQGANGTVTSECLNANCCWFHIGCKKCAPKHCDCTLVGEYCGCYVWVTEEGRDELSKLTLAILDFALNSPPQKRTKEIVYNIDEYGLPTTNNLAVGKVTASVAIDENPEALLKMSQDEEIRIVDFLDYRHQRVKQRLATAVNPQETEATPGRGPDVGEQARLLAQPNEARRPERTILSEVAHSLECGRPAIRPATKRPDAAESAYSRAVSNLFPRPIPHVATK